MRDWLDDSCSAAENLWAMDFQALEGLIANDKSLEEKKLSVIHSMNEDAAAKPKKSLEPTEALKVFFDRIPLSSIPGIDNSGVFELDASDSIGEAIAKLHKEKLLGAPVREGRLSVDSLMSDKYIGLVDFSGMVLWALEEMEVAEPRVAVSQEVMEALGFFGLLAQLDAVKSAKLGALANSFRWGPFLPVKPDDSLLQVLLLLSKHTLKAVPVIDSRDRLVKGFVTQNATVQLLLQCSGLAWFDAIAEKTLSDLRSQMGLGASETLRVFHDDPIIQAMKVMWKFRISAVPVVNRSSNRLMGNVRSTDVRLMLEKPELFHQRRVMSVEDYMQAEAAWNKSEPSSDDVGVSICAATLSLGKIGFLKMLEPLVCKAEDTLKGTMEKLVQARSDRSFFLDDKCCVTGVITLRDIIGQFAPPLVEPPTRWSGFFETALQLTSSS